MKVIIKKVIASNSLLKFLFIKFQNSRRRMVDEAAAELSKMSKAGNHKGVFDFIYHKKYWHSDESVSGWGSTLEITKALRPKLEKVIRDLAVTSFLDVPCGDFNWMKEVDFGQARYIGGDIVKDLIDDLNQKYANEKRSFVQIDLVSDNLPEVDMIFIRDCFIHLSNDLVVKALENISKSKIKYLVTTHSPKMIKNAEIETGEFREVNLCRPPFHLPEPTFIVNEGCTDPLLVDKSLGVWKIADLKK